MQLYAFISAEEVRGRIQDYRRQGWTVVWILHDRRYNQSRLTAAEWVLRSHPTYFTNIDEEGQGCIYDQFDYYQQGWRQSTLSPLPVSLAEPRFLTVRSKQSLRLLNERIQAWPLYFKGDLLDQGIEGKGNYLEKALEIEQGLFVSQHCSIWYRIKNRCHRLFIRPYLLLLQMWLENACR
jgi:competence protein CoiA